MKEIEFINQNLPTKKIQAQLISLVNSMRPKKEIIPILHKSFPKTEEEGTFPNSFYQAGITHSKYDKKQ